MRARLNDEDLEKLDALVETELFKSRSEVAAYFIQEGINSKKDLFDRVMPTIEQIKQLKEELKEAIR
jgi:Arc/MetJ-type ribon-helix-helix transcriptional regulator